MNEFGQIVGFSTDEQGTLRAALWTPVAGPLAVPGGVGHRDVSFGAATPWRERMSSAWTLLIVAGLLEVVWAVGLKYTEGFTRTLPSAITLTAMVLSIVLLGRALRTIPVGTGYAVWTGIGAVGTAVVGILVLGEPKDSGRLIALTAIIGGIVGLKLASPH
jgi:quaternary ammonium compound-resistance protein SugE